MGKVGSTSLAAAIPGAQHLHTLYNNHPCPYFQCYTSSFARRCVSVNVMQPLRRFSYYRRPKLKIISIVRDPVARNMSMFFQDLPFWIAGYVKKFDKETRKSDLPWLWEVYKNIFNHDYAANWFDREMLRFTNIDVLASGFDIESGCQTYRNGNIELLVLRLEDLQKNKKALESFIGESLQIANLNKSESKWYASIYRDFQELYAENVRALEVPQYERFRSVFGYE